MAMAVSLDLELFENLLLIGKWANLKLSEAREVDIAAELAPRSRETASANLVASYVSKRSSSQ